MARLTPHALLPLALLMLFVLPLQGMLASVLPCNTTAIDTAGAYAIHDCNTSLPYLTLSTSDVSILIENATLVGTIALNPPPIFAPIRNVTIRLVNVTVNIDNAGVVTINPVVLLQGAFTLEVVNCKNVVVGEGLWGGLLGTGPTLSALFVTGPLHVSVVDSNILVYNRVTSRSLINAVAAVILLSISAPEWGNFHVSFLRSTATLHQSQGVVVSTIALVFFYVASDGSNFTFTAEDCNFQIGSAAVFLTPNDVLPTTSSIPSSLASSVFAMRAKGPRTVDSLNITLRNVSEVVNASMQLANIWLDAINVTRSVLCVSNFTVNATVLGAITNATTTRSAASTINAQSAWFLNTSVSLENIVVWCTIQLGVHAQSVLSVLDGTTVFTFSLFACHHCNIRVQRFLLNITSADDTSANSAVVNNYNFVALYLAGVLSHTNVTIIDTRLSLDVGSTCPTFRTAYLTRSVPAYQRGNPLLGVLSTNSASISFLVAIVLSIATSSHVTVTCESCTVYLKRALVTNDCRPVGSWTPFPLTVLAYASVLAMLNPGTVVVQNLYVIDNLLETVFIVAVLKAQAELRPPLHVNSTTVSVTSSSVLIQSRPIGCATALLQLLYVVIADSSLVVKPSSDTLLPSGSGSLASPWIANPMVTWFNSTRLQNTSVTFLPWSSSPSVPWVITESFSTWIATRWSQSTVLLDHQRISTGSGAGDAVTGVIRVTNSFISDNSRFLIQGGEFNGTKLFAPPGRKLNDWSSNSFVTVKCAMSDGRPFGFGDVGGNLVRASVQFVGCLPSSSSPTVTVSESKAPPEAPQESALYPVSRVAVVATFVSALQSPASSLGLLRAVASLRHVACDGNDAMSVPLDLTANPLQLEVGTEYGAAIRGSLIGNVVVLWGGCFVLMCVAVALTRLCQGVSWARAVEARSFPGWSITFVSPLLPPIVSSATMLLSATTYSTPAKVESGDVAGAVLSLFLSAAVVLAYSLLVRHCCTTGKIRHKALHCSRRSSNPRQRQRESSKKYGSAVTELLWRLRLWLCQPQFSWVAAQPEIAAGRRAARRMIACFGDLFVPCHPKRYWWQSLDLGFSFLISVLSGVMPTTDAGCLAVSVTLAVLLCAYLLLVVLVARPLFTKRLDEALYVVNVAGGAVVAVAACIGVTLLMLVYILAALNLVSNLMFLADWIAIKIEARLPPKGAALELEAMGAVTPQDSLRMLIELACATRAPGQHRNEPVGMTRSTTARAQAGPARKRIA